MAPVSTTAHIQNVFNALERLEHFEYSSIQLHTFYQNTIPTKSSSTKTRSSAYQAFRAENKGNKDAPKWSDIKDDIEEFSKYETVAISLNLQRGFSNEDPKIINKIKTEQRILSLQTALDVEKQKKYTTTTTTTTTTTNHTFDDIDINKDGVITREEFDTFNLNKPISIEPDEPDEPDELEEVVDEPDEVVDELEELEEPEEPEEPEEVVDEPEEVVDEPVEPEEPEEVVDEPEEVVDEPVEVVDEIEEVVDEPVEVVDEIEEVVDEPEEVLDEPEEVLDEPEEVVDEPEEVLDEPEEVVDEIEEVVDEIEEVVDEPEEVLEEKPLYTGKSALTSKSNFKQWILNENQLPFNSSISNVDYVKYKEQYNYDNIKYRLDDECPWFEFIKNNMSIQ